MTQVSRVSGPALVFAVGCFLLSGTTGLLYEIAWARALGAFLGSTTYAHTVVLAAFMGGLGLGNHFFGPRADRAESPLKLYGALEIGIGVYGLVFPWLMEAFGSLYVAAGRGLGPTSGGILPLKLALSAAALLLPATLMGGTLPALGRWMTRRGRDVGARVGLLYFINTAGAVLGCWLGGFVLLEAVGLRATIFVAAVINLAIGAAVLGLEGFLTGEPGESAEESAETSREGRVWSDGQVKVAMVAIGISGGLTMLYELAWIRLVAFVFGSSSQSFSAMLMTFVGGIALGGLLAGWVLRKDRDALWLFGLAEVGVSLGVMAALPLYERFPYLFAVLRASVARSDGGFVLLQVLEVLLLCLLMLIPTTLIGMTLPLASRVAVRRVEELGQKVGRVFAINTAGTVLGVVLTGLWVLPWLGLQGSLYLGLVASAVLGVVLLVAARPKRRGLAVGVAAGVLVAFVAVAGGTGLWDPVLMNAGFFRKKAAPVSFEAMKARFEGHKLLFHEDGVDTTVAVVEVDGERFLKVNGKTDASTLRGDMVTQIISGHLPMLLHSGEPEEVLVIGLGSGVTAGSAALYPEAKVQVVEISQSVADGARHFSAANRGVLDHPQVTMHIGDARDFLLLEDATYDVIISEPSNPWISGVAGLFSKEFMEILRSRLSKDGMYLQWLQLYAFSDEALDRCLNTLRSVFAHVTVWRFTPTDCLILASQEPIKPKVETIAARLSMPGVATDLGPERPIPIASPTMLLAHQALSEDAVTSAFPGRPPLNTDTQPYLEFEAPRAMFRGRAPTRIDALDERREDRGDKRLLVGPLIGEITVEEARQVVDLLDRSGQRRLASGVRFSLGTMGDWTPEARRDDMARGVNDAALIDRIEVLLSDPAPMSSQDCAFHHARLARRYVETANAFVRANPDVLSRLGRRCAADHPAQASRLLIDRAAAFYAIGRGQNALPLAERAYKAAPEGSEGRELRLDALRLLARSALDTGHGEKARWAYEQILSIDPRDDEARKMLGQ